MDTLYSLTLFISLATGVMALLLALALYIKQPQPQPCRLASFRYAMLFIICIAILALVVSLVVHLVSGHRPGSPQALGIGEFFAVHPAYLAAIVLPLAAFILAWAYCRKLKDGQDGEG